MEIVMERLHELIMEYRAEYGLLPAKKMAKEQYLREMMDDLCEIDLTTTEKVDRIISILELMNMKVD
jgi:hypothetical protein